MLISPLLTAMKIIKIIFAVLAALWALALVPKLLVGITHGSGDFAFSHIKMESDSWYPDPDGH